MAKCFNSTESSSGLTYNWSKLYHISQYILGSQMHWGSQNLLWYMIYDMYFGSVLCKAWWWLSRVETCCHEIILYNNWCVWLKHANYMNKNRDRLQHPHGYSRVKNPKTLLECARRKGKGNMSLAKPRFINGCLVLSNQKISTISHSWMSIITHVLCNTGV